MNLVIATLLAVAPLEVEVLNPEGKRVELSLLRADGGVAWSRTANTSASFTTTCVPSGTFKVNSTREELHSVSTDVRCAVSVSVSDRGVYVTSTRVALPPKELVVRVEEADDSTGLATFAIENQTNQALAVVDVGIDATLVPPWNDCVFHARLVVEPMSSRRVPMQVGVCARQLSSQPHRRTLRLRAGSAVYEFVFPFSRTSPASQPRVLFPNEPFQRLACNQPLIGRSVLLTSRTGQQACACAGDLVGSLKHRLVIEQGKLCGQLPDGGQCERPFSMNQNVGDFPELPPHYRQDGE